MDAEEEEFDLNMDIVEAPLARPKAIPREKRDCVYDLLIRGSKNLSPEENVTVTKLLVKHTVLNATTETLCITTMLMWKWKMMKMCLDYK